ncbi:MAG: CRISPR-associated ring nuclease Csm6, partial [Methylocaldum sp.]|nr:CRISPR-associated ring nuclease Csm6 [Methylocaldum sp.]
MTYPRRILLVITGLTPQVVTETLFALWQEAPETLPTEIHVISTAAGVERSRLTLVSEEAGGVRRLCKDYRLPPIRFGADSLHTLTDGDGRPLTDIRSGEDNTAAADGITEWVRRLTEDDDTQWRGSCAGGRSTLGLCAGLGGAVF